MRPKKPCWGIFSIYGSVRELFLFQTSNFLFYSFQSSSFGDLGSAGEIKTALTSKIQYKLFLSSNVMYQIRGLNEKSDYLVVQEVNVSKYAKDFHSLVLLHVLELKAKRQKLRFPDKQMHITVVFQLFRDCSN